MQNAATIAGLSYETASNGLQFPVAVPAPGQFDLAVAPREGDARLERVGNNWMLSAEIRNLSGISYQGQVAPTPILKASLYDQDGMQIWSSARDFDLGITARGNFRATWTGIAPPIPVNTDPGAQPNHFRIELLNLVDATVLNNSRDVYLNATASSPEPSCNLLLESFDAHPPVGVIATAQPATSNVSFEGVVVNEFDHAFERVGIDLVDETRGIVLWSHVYPQLVAGGRLIVQTRDIPLPAGTHVVRMRIDPFNTIAESRENDNQRLTTVVIEDRFEREKPDLHFSAQQIESNTIGDITVIRLLVANSLPQEHHHTPQPANSFQLACYDSAGTLLGATRCAGLEGDQQQIIAVSLPTTTMGSLKFKLDPTSVDLPFGQVDESNESNNTLEWSLYAVPPPEGLDATAVIQKTIIGWRDSALLGTANYLPISELAGYWAERWRGGILESSRLVVSPPDPGPNYTLSDDNLAAGTAYEYRIYTLARNGHASQPLILHVTTGKQAKLQVFKAGTSTQIPNGQLLTPTDSSGNRIDIKVDAPGAEEVELFINNQAYVLNTQVNGLFFKTNVELKTGINTFFARAVAHLGGATYHGSITNPPFRITCQTGVDLTGSSADIKIMRQNDLPPKN